MKVYAKRKPPYHIIKICVHCGSRDHGATKCDASSEDILVYRIRGLARDWENTALNSKDPLIVSRQNTLRECGTQLLKFVEEYQDKVKDKSIVEAFKESRGSANTSSIRLLFPSLYAHEGKQ